MLSIQGMNASIKKQKLSHWIGKQHRKQCTHKKCIVGMMAQGGRDQLGKDVSDQTALPYWKVRASGLKCRPLKSLLHSKQAESRSKQTAELTSGKLQRLSGRGRITFPTSGAQTVQD